jgi:hypothetical protein
VGMATGRLWVKLAIEVRWYGPLLESDVDEIQNSRADSALDGAVDHNYRYVAVCCVGRVRSNTQHFLET